MGGTYGGPHPRTVVALYRSARVHVLPSWFETTGLVSLEAGLCRCDVREHNRGHAREYLGDFAWYCDPADPASICSAVWMLEQPSTARDTRAHPDVLHLGTRRPSHPRGLSEVLARDFGARIAIRCECLSFILMLSAGPKYPFA